MAKETAGAAHALLQALRHPLRRRLLRFCIEAREDLSPKELALLAGHPVLSNVAYHVRALAKNGALELVRTEPVRGAVEHFYRPAKLVADMPWVLAAISEGEAGALSEEERARLDKHIAERRRDTEFMERLREDD